MTDIAEALLPCPFCGEKGVAREVYLAIGRPNHHKVCCYNCAVQTPIHGVKAEAIAAWNRRSTPATQPDEKAHWQAWAKKRLENQSRQWLTAARTALNGDMRLLRNRVELADAPPVDLVLSAAPALSIQGNEHAP